MTHLELLESVAVVAARDAMEAAQRRLPMETLWALRKDADRAAARWRRAAERVGETPDLVPTPKISRTGRVLHGGLERAAPAGEAGLFAGLRPTDATALRRLAARIPRRQSAKKRDSGTSRRSRRTDS